MKKNKITLYIFLTLCIQLYGQKMECSQKVLIPEISKDSIIVVFQKTYSKSNYSQSSFVEKLVKNASKYKKEIDTAVFKSYQDQYAMYKEAILNSGDQRYSKGSSTERERILPTPKSADYLKSFYQVVAIYVPEKIDLMKLDFGIEYLPTWDVFKGIGIKIQNWKVKDIGGSDIAK